MEVIFILVLVLTRNSLHQVHTSNFLHHLSEYHKCKFLPYTRGHPYKTYITKLPALFHRAKITSALFHEFVESTLHRRSFKRLLFLHEMMAKAKKNILKRWHWRIKSGWSDISVRSLLRFQFGRNRKFLFGKALSLACFTLKISSLCIRVVALASWSLFLSRFTRSWTSSSCCCPTCRRPEQA